MTVIEILKEEYGSEWKEVFKQRCAPAAHPQVRELMIPLRDKFKSLIPEIYE